MSTYKRTSTPAAVVTTAEAKAWLRVDHSNDDSFIDDLIGFATKRIETKTQRQLTTATWVRYLDKFPTGVESIELERCPVQSVTSITYVDTDGNTQTLDSANYRVDAKSEPGRITPGYGLNWPSTRRITNAVTVTFVAGYGDAADVDPLALTAIRFAVAYMYSNRLMDLPDDVIRGVCNLLKWRLYA